MVKNRNWQRRVEVASARREENKQRKLRKDNRGIYKSMVHDLLDFMDQHRDSITSTAKAQAATADGSLANYVLHVWTDEIPTDSPPFLDMYEENFKEQGKVVGFRKMRSMSMQEEENNNTNGNSNSSSARKGQRCRSGSLGEAPSSGKKKVHPRSKEALAAANQEEEASSLATLRLCRKHFFTGKCSESKGACRFYHYSPQYKTLSMIMSGNSKVENGARETLTISETAYTSSTDESADGEVGGMEMVYYFSIDLKINEQEPKTLCFSELVANELSRKSCGIGSIVYLAVNGVLIFDRYRDGVLPTKALMIERHRSRGESIGEESEGGETNIFESLPGPILEDILVFLPDAAVAMASMVCRSWWNEIGRTSPNLWRHLLQRRSWPCPALKDVGHVDDGGVTFRNEFIHHYTAARDLKSLQAGMASTFFNKTMNDNDVVACQSFAARRGAPQFPNGCIAVEVWSPGALVAAYAQDCSLRLFKAVTRSGTTSVDDNLMFCRELACYRVDPYQNTKRRTCRLVGMGLDDEVIGCLCHVVDERVRKESFLLCVLTREEFLLSDPSAISEGGGGVDLDKEALLVIDICNAVVNYLVTGDEIDDPTMRLIDFLTDGGTVEEVEVLVSQSIAACGGGRFLVEVAISIPNEELDGDDSDIVMMLLQRKLVLFSASAGAILWTGDSTSAGETLSPRHEDMTLSSVRVSQPERRIPVCYFSVVSSTTVPVLAGVVEPNGHVISPQLLGALNNSPIVVEEQPEEGAWELRRMHRRPFVMTQSGVVMVDTFSREIDDEGTMVRSVISFVPNVFDEAASRSSIDLENCDVFRLCFFSTEHIVALCRVQKRRRARSVVVEQPQQQVDGEDTDNDNTEEDENETFRVSLDAIIIHVKSRQQLERVCLLEDLTPEMNPSSLYDVPVFLASDGNTVGLAVGWKGVLLTGSDVRSTHLGRERLSSEDKSKKKKKKLRLSSKGSKKDGFVRGMSVRG